MGLTNFPNGITSFGQVVWGSGGSGADMGISRGTGKNDATVNSKTKVIYVDSAATGTGDGTSWANACTTIQAGINLARYDFGTTTINYDDSGDKYVYIAPGNYSSEGRIAFSAKNLHIVGIGQPGTDTGVTIAPTSPTTFAFGGSGTGITIENLCISVTSAVYALYWEQMDGNCLFKDLYIVSDGTGTHGIYTGGLKGGSTIQNCKINGFTTANIYVAGGANMYYSDARIVGNQLGGSPTDSIYISNTVTASNGIVAHNYITGAPTDAIEVAATAAQVLVADNWIVAGNVSGGTQRDNHTV